jgi:hypothetical protein
MFFVAVIISAPPKLEIAGFELLMPSYYLHETFPMFRAFIRFGIVAMLALSVLAGLGIAALLRRLNSFGKQLFVASLVVALVLIEFLNVPPSKATDVSVSSVPPVYKWLASQPGDFTIAEYPVPVEMPHKFYAYMFYQRIHRRRLADVRQIPFLEGKEHLYNLLRPGVTEVLRYLGVKYVIVHSDEYRSTGGAALTFTAEHGLKLVRVFPNTMVYEVIAEPSKVLWMPEDGFFAPEFWGGWENHQDWVWMKERARLLAVNSTGRETHGDIVFRTRALGVPRILRIKINESEKELQVPPSVTEVTIRDVRLEPGENNLSFSTTSTAEEIDKYFMNGDRRSATFMLSEFEFRN